MSRAFSAPGQSWQGQRLSDDARRRLIKEGRGRAEDIAGAKQDYKRASLWFGIAGCAMGVLGMACAASMFAYVTLNPQEVVVVERDHDGVVSVAQRAVKGAESFNEVTAKQHLRAFLENCEGYLFATARATATRCQLFLAPEMRARWVEHFNGEKGPQHEFGRTGSVSVADRATYTPRVTGRNGTQVWTIAWNRVEAKPGSMPRCLPWSTEVTFRWRPELAMAEDDRPHNAGGMQISRILSQPDVVRSECR